MERWEEGRGDREKGEGRRGKRGRRGRRGSSGWRRDCGEGRH